MRGACEEVVHGALFPALFVEVRSQASVVQRCAYQHVSAGAQLGQRCLAPVVKLFVTGVVDCR